MCIKVLVGKPKGKRPLGKSARRMGNIEMDLQEMVWVAWTALDRNRCRALVNAVMNLRVP
jgi:hypothetical protein